MKNLNGIFLAYLGLLATLMSPDLFDDQLLQYSVIGLGVLIACIGIFKSGQEYKQGNRQA